MGRNSYVVERVERNTKVRRVITSPMTKNEALGMLAKYQRKYADSPFYDFRITEVDN